MPNADLFERPYTVSQLTREIKVALEDGFGAVYLVGELTNVRRPSSGHVYLTLKDDRAQISAVMWRGPASRLPFALEDGMEVLVEGELTVYEPRGQYQIVIRRMQPRGVGALQIAFLKMKEKLEREGLFDPSRKRPLPFMPRKIGIATSPTGAAVRDMLRAIYARFPAAQVVLAPCSVQGAGAALEIARSVRDLNAVPGVDVIVVGRGGGSLEDLWAFNEEPVARAIYASRVPVVSAVGHEIDITISDLVADARAMTPTDAGRLVAPETEQIEAALQRGGERLAAALRGRVARARERLDALERSYALRRPLDRVLREEQRVDELAQRLSRCARSLTPMLRQRLGALAGKFEALGPTNVLARGYSITFGPDGHVLRRAGDVRPGDRLRTLLADGEFASEALGR